jgi:hypothetical protein
MIFNKKNLVFLPLGILMVAIHVLGIGLLFTLSPAEVLAVLFFIVLPFYLMFTIALQEWVR